MVDYLGKHSGEEIDSFIDDLRSGKAIADNLKGKGYIFEGMADPETKPNVSNLPVFYIATKPGVYVNFSSLVVNEGEPVILFWDNGTWIKQSFGFVPQSSFAELRALVEILLKSPFFKNNIIGHSYVGFAELG